MKRYFILATLLIIGLSSCQKYTTTGLAATQATVDDQKIQDYIAANKLTLTKDASGIYYQIVTPGTTPNPTTSSTVKLTYTSTYLNGAFYAKLDGYSGKLNTFARALQLTIPKIGTNGRIILIAPSRYVYGNTTFNDVPPNTIFYFIVDLNGVSN